MKYGICRYFVVAENRPYSGTLFDFAEVMEKVEWCHRTWDDEWLVVEVNDDGSRGHIIRAVYDRRDHPPCCCDHCAKDKTRNSCSEAQCWDEFERVVKTKKAEPGNG